MENNFSGKIYGGRHIWIKFIFLEQLRSVHHCVQLFLFCTKGCGRVLGKTTKQNN